MEQLPAGPYTLGHLRKGARTVTLNDVVQWGDDETAVVEVPADTVQRRWAAAPAVVALVLRALPDLNQLQLPADAPLDGELLDLPLHQSTLGRDQFLKRLNVQLDRLRWLRDDLEALGLDEKGAQELLDAGVHEVKDERVLEALKGCSKSTHRLLALLVALRCEGMTKTLPSELLARFNCVEHLAEESEEGLRRDYARFDSTNLDALVQAAVKCRSKCRTASTVAAVAEVERVEFSGKDFRGWYNRSAELGRGAFGIVYKGYYTRVGQRERQCAVKTGANLAADEESSRWPSGGHVVGCIGGAQLVGSNASVLVLERGHGSLRDRLECAGTLEPRRALQLLGQVAVAMAACHDVNVFHRDLRSPNVVLACSCDVNLLECRQLECSNAVAKIADFGSALTGAVVEKVLENPDKNREVLVAEFLGSPPHIMAHLQTARDRNHIVDLLRKCDLHNFAGLCWEAYHACNGTLDGRFAAQPTPLKFPQPAEHEDSCLKAMRTMAARIDEGYATTFQYPLDAFNLVLKPPAATPVMHWLVDKLRKYSKLKLRLELVGRARTDAQQDLSGLIWPRITVQCKEATARHAQPTIDAVRLHAFLNGERALVHIVGPAGYGKSSLAKWVAWSWAAGAGPLAAELCVCYISLPDELWRNADTETGPVAPSTVAKESFFVAFLKRFLKTIASADGESVDTMLVQHGDKILFVLDGVDKAMHEASQKNDQRALAWLKGLAVSVDPLVYRALVVGRPDSQVDALQGNVLEVAGFASDEDQFTFVRDVSQLNAARVAAVEQMLLQSPAARELCRSPLALDLVCYLYARSNDVKAIDTLTELYRQVVGQFVTEAGAAGTGKSVLSVLYSADWARGVKNVLCEQSDSMRLVLLRTGLFVSEGSAVVIDEDGLEVASWETHEWRWYHDSIEEFVAAFRFVKQVQQGHEQRRPSGGATDLPGPSRSPAAQSTSTLFWQFAVGLASSKPQVVYRTVWNAMFAALWEHTLSRLLSCVEIRDWRTHVAALKEVEPLAVRAASFLTAAHAFECVETPLAALHWYEAALACSDSYGAEMRAFVLLGMGNCAETLGSHQRVELFDRALDVLEHGGLRESTQYVGALTHRGMAHLLRDEDIKALELFKKAQCITKATIGTQNAYYAATLNDIALVLQKQRKFGTALHLFEEALLIQAVIFGKRSKDYATTLANMAAVYDDKGDFGEALKLYEEARSIEEATIGKQNAIYATTLNNIALVHKKQLDFVTALKLYKEVLRILEATIGTQSDRYATTLTNMGDTHMEQSTPAEALKLYEEAAGIRATIGIRKDASYATLLNQVGVAHIALNQYAQGASFFEQASAIYCTVRGKDHIDTLVSMRNLALCSLKLNNTATARPIIDKVRAGLKRCRDPCAAELLADFEQQLPRQLRIAPPRRNSLCDCGSKKKAKRCCHKQ